MIPSSPTVFLLAFPDTFIFDNNVGGDRQWQRTWRVVRPRPHDKSAFTAYNRIGVDHHRQTNETWCVMVSILGHGIADISEGEHGGLLTVINRIQEKLVGIGSDKLPSLQWDLGVHFVSRLFHLMMK